MALRGVNASAGPFARSTANAARPRARSTQSLPLTSGGRYGLWCNQNTKTHPSTPQTGPDYEYPRHPDHPRTDTHERSLRGQECCGRVARSVLLRRPHLFALVPAVLPGYEVNIGPNNYSRLHSLALVPSCPGVGVETLGAGGCLFSALPSWFATREPPTRLISGTMVESAPLASLAELFLERYSPPESLPCSVPMLVIWWVGFSGAAGFREYF